MASLSALVVGGGIGGLAVSLALRARGFSVVVLEQAESIREVGAGIQISPNGLRVLDALGLGAQFRAISLRAEAVSLRDHRASREVTRLNVGQLADRTSYRFVHRADLIDLLAKTALDRGVEIRLDARAVSVVADADVGARVTLDGGEALAAPLVVAADGVHSVARAALNGAQKPFFTGQVAWRAVVPNTLDHPLQAWVHMGPGRHMVSYPLRDASQVNIVAVEERRDWTAEGWNHTDSADALRTAFAGFGGMAGKMLAEVSEPGLWGLFRHPVATHWHDGGLALLGDAAHPTLPFLAQGANMALEDAWVLGVAAAHPGGARLDLYQALRRDRVQRVISAANRNAWKYHLRNPLVRGLAHVGLSVAGRIAPGRLVGQFDWLYGHDVTAVTGSLPGR